MPSIDWISPAHSTYIQSGNIGFKKCTTSPKRVSQKIKGRAFMPLSAYDVPYLVKTILNKRNIKPKPHLQGRQRLGDQKMVLWLLQEVPNTELASKLQQDQFQ